MTLHISLSDEKIQLLREALGNDLDRAALEALATEGYRRGKLSAWQVGQLIGVNDRWLVEKWLADRSVPLNYGLEELEADRNTIQDLFGKKV